jgi:hypothetical protein
MISSKWQLELPSRHQNYVSEACSKQHGRRIMSDLKEKGVILARGVKELREIYDNRAGLLVLG